MATIVPSLCESFDVLVGRRGLPMQAGGKTEGVLAKEDDRKKRKHLPLLSIPSTVWGNVEKGEIG
jgi:hypothetical protein